jgi:polyferredoxin
LVYIKYGILGVVLLIGVMMAALTTTDFGSRYRSALGVFAEAPFNALSPHDTLFAILPVMTYGAITADAPFADVLGVVAALPPLFWVRLAILIAVLAFAVYLPRSWCRYICPVGAGLALASQHSLLGLKRDLVHCTREGCKQCVDVCPMKVPILELPWEKFTHPECTYCLECVDECGTRALKPKFL